MAGEFDTTLNRDKVVRSISRTDLRVVRADCKRGQGAGWIQSQIITGINGSQNDQSPGLDRPLRLKIDATTAEIANRDQVIDISMQARTVHADILDATMLTASLAAFMFQRLIGMVGLGMHV